MLQIVVRKVYHLLAMSLFVPVLFWDIQLLGLSLAIAFAALVLLEVLRCLRLPVLGQAVQDFMQVRCKRQQGVHPCQLISSLFCCSGSCCA